MVAADFLNRRRHQDKNQIIGVLMEGVVAPFVAGRVEKDQIVRDPALALDFLRPRA